MVLVNILLIVVVGLMDHRNLLYGAVCIDRAGCLFCGLKQRSQCCCVSPRPTSLSVYM